MLILKQNSANSVPTPPAGKGTIFLDDSDTLSVKTSDGNVETFPTVAASNAQVVFMNGTALSGEAAFTYDFNNNILSVTGNVAAGNIKTDNLLYANGNPWDLSDPGGSNTQVQFNDSESFGGSAAFTFNNSTNAVSMGGTLNVTGNANVGNIGAAAGVFTTVAGSLTTASQPNVTSVGTLTTVKAGATALGADFPNSTSIFSHDNTAVLASDNFGLVGEATGDGANTSTTGVGVFGIGKANSGTRGTGVQGFATVTNSADTGAAVGVRGYATSTHAGGYNIGVLGNAAGSGYGNYAFYVQAGNIGSIETNTAWDLNDNSASSLAFNSSGKANILAISTVDGSEGVSMSGTLTVTGNANVGGIKTDNYYYANGSPVDFQQAGGSNTQIQFNDADSFGGSAAFTFNKTSNLVSMSGNLSVANVQATGDVTTATLTSNGNANVGNLGTGGLITATGNISGGNLTTGGVVSATGNVSGGNITTAGLVNATGNVTGGNLTTAGAVVATGNVSGGNLTTGGVVAATGNVSGGNVNTAGKVVASTLESNVATGTAPFTVASTTKVTNLNADLLDGYSTATAATANTVVIRDADGSFSANVVTATLSGAATTAGTVTTAAQPNITSVGTLTGLGVNGTVTAVAFTANTGVFTGNGSGLTNLAAGNITGQVANALVAGTVYTAAQPNITSVGTLSSLDVTANVVAGNVYANSGTIGASLLTGTLTTAAQPNVTSVGTLTGLGVNGNITAANITANTGVFTGNGSGLSQLAGGNVTGQVGNALVAGTVYTAAQPNITSVGTLSSLAVTGNVTAGNVYANSGTIGASLVAGTLTTAAQPNITSIGTLSSLTVTGNVAAGNLTTTGVLTVSGTGVSSIAGNLDMTSNTIINLATPTNASDAATKQYVDDVAQGLNIHDSCQAATPDTLANITSGTITYNNGTAGVGATLVTTGTFNLIDGVNVQTAGTRILVKNEANAVFNGIYTYTNTTAITRALDYDTIPEVEAGDFTFVTGGTLYDNTGWVQTDSPAAIGTAGNTINFTQFSGAGTYNAGTGLTLTGSTFSVNAAQTQITSVGTLSSLGVSGTITAANITANTGVFTGNGSGLSAIAGGNVTGQVGNALVAGTVYTAAQPNITSVGTLTSLSVTGNVSAGNVSGTLLTGTLATAAQPNVTSLGTLTGLGVNGTITGVNITANTGVFTGNGSGLSAIAGGNVTGQVGNALVAGTVYTAAQPNITSVGTLSSLTVSGNVGAGNVNATSAVVASTLTSNVATGTAPLTVTSTTRVANLNVAYANVADLINVSDVTTGTYYPILANAATGNVSEGSNTALTFAAATGTLSATVFSGSGASLTNLNASNISTGTLAQARLANSSLTVNGTAISLGGSGTITANTTQTLTFGSYLTGTSFNGGTANTIAVDATTTNTASKVVARDASGNFSAGTITATLSGAATTAGTVTTAAQPNITSVGTLTSVTVTGDVVCNGYFDASVNAAVSAAGTAQGNATVIASQVNVVSTVASGAGVVLPTAVAGYRITLINTAANACLVYPASGGQINALGTNISYSLPAGGRLDYQATSTTQWYTLNATYG